ncbi:Uncharacterised protein [uncultured archaeon]|nr:Uncharacterised protein [uncultured archaeon]
MADIIRDYFISPIFERTGYNAVNTLVYAAIALGALYLIWRFLKRKNFDFASREFLYGVAAFVLFGSTCRVLTDLSDAGGIASASHWVGILGQVYSLVASSGIFTYGYLTVTPGIYVITALLFIISIALGKAMKNDWFPTYAGVALWLPCMLLLIPFMQNFYFFLLVLAIAGVGAYAAFWLLENFGKLELGTHAKLAIAGQALDGAATFVVIDIFSKQAGMNYFEQHVLSAGIGTATPLGFGLFLLIKIALASLIVYFVSKEKMDAKDTALILIVVAIMGFAPGIRDVLRMLCGT